MKNWKLKKTGTWMLLAVFIVSAVASMTGLTLEGKAATSDFVLTHNYTNTLTPGDAPFKMTLLMKATASNTTINNIQIDFSDAGIVSLVSGGTLVTSSTQVGSTEANIATFDLRFTGDGSTGIFPVTVNYTLDNLSLIHI
ncbi:MAG: hypothetical protein N2376_13110 [Clostridia bacterium]|nr:hypothetical protein [Clostridia bacterium]